MKKCLFLMIIATTLMFCEREGMGPSYSVGGSVTGLESGEAMVLQLNLGSGLQRSNNGPFTFPTPLANGSFYDVTVLTAPAGKTCSVARSAGHITGANVADVQVV